MQNASGCQNLSDGNTGCHLLSTVTEVIIKG